MKAMRKRGDWHGPLKAVGIVKRYIAVLAGVSIEEIEGPGRTRVLVHARQAAMYLSRELTARSLTEIGGLFGNRDHSTVAHAVKAVEKRMSGDPDLARRLADYRAELGSIMATGDASPESLEEVVLNAEETAVRRAKTEPGRPLAARSRNLRNALLRHYGETVVARGDARDGGGAELLVSDQGTWSIIGLDGPMARLVAAGTGWREVAPGGAVVSAFPLPGNNDPKERVCLKCQNLFPSWGPGNQTCPTCVRKNEKLTGGLDGDAF